MDRIIIRLGDVSISKQNLEFVDRHYFKAKNDIVWIYRLKRFEGQSDRNFDALTVKLTNAKNLTIDGSIRKWWFGNERFSADFNYIQFCSCIEALAEKLGLDIKEFWRARVTFREIGGCIRLPRSFDFLLSSMVYFPRLKAEQFETTQYFKSNSSDIIAYDKSAEAIKGLKPNLKAKLLKSFFVLRLERKIRKTNDTVLYHRANSLEQIRDNWIFLVDNWRDTFCRMEFSRFEDWITMTETKIPKNVNELKNFSLADMAYKHPEFINQIVSNEFDKRRLSQSKAIIRKAMAEYQAPITKNAIALYHQKIHEKAEKMKFGAL